MKKYWHVWVGQNASCGNPHPITGHYNYWGKIFKFRSKQERDQYYDEWRPYNSSERIEKVNKKSARKYFLGSSVSSYLEYMDHYAHLMVKISNRWESTY